MPKLLLLLILPAILDCSSAAAQSRAAPNAPPSGARLTFRETSRSATSDGEFAHYAFQADGFPQEKSYSLTGKWMNGKTRSFQALRIDGSGRVFSPDGVEVDLTLGKMFPGEFIEFTLAADDGTAKASVEITPFPMEAAGDGGCRLMVKPMSVRGDILQISGSGFRPDQEIKVVATLDRMSHDERWKAKADGTVQTVVFPGGAGRNGGEGIVTASDGACSVTVRYDWGVAVAQATPSQRWEAVYGDAATLYGQRKYSDALSAAREAARVAEAYFGPQHLNVAKSLSMLGAVYVSQSKFTEAEPLFKRSLAMAEKAVGPNDPAVGQTLAFLAGFYRHQKRYAEAAPLYKRSLAILEKTAKPDDPGLAGLVAEYADVLRKTGQSAEAEKMAARARSFHAQAERATGDMSTEAEAAYRKGDHEAFLELLRELQMRDRTFTERYRKAAMAGSPAAQGILGVMYEEGIGVSKDPAESIAWFRKAADQGDSTAQKYLGDMYRGGVGVPADPGEAMKWYRRSAEQGDGTAQGMLGLIYERGLGVKRDLVQAYMWYTLASAYFESPIRDQMIDVVRGRVSALMSKAEIEEAEQLVREWKPTRSR